MAKSKQLSGLDKMFELSKPFDKKDIQWRVQRLTKDGTAGLALAYINVRQVQDRLNEVMGTDWQTKHEVFGAKTICSLGLKLDGEWIWRSDGAGDTTYEADKGAISDSLKRAAVSFGIGRHLYDLPSVWIKCETYNGKFKRWTEDPWDKVRQSNSDFS